MRCFIFRLIYAVVKVLLCTLSLVTGTRLIRAQRLFVRSVDLLITQNLKGSWGPFAADDLVLVLSSVSCRLRVPAGLVSGG